MTKSITDSNLRPEYDFTGGVRGKHYRARLNGYIIKIHKRDGTIQVIKIKRKLITKGRVRKLR
jgi:hypothetical protein